MPSTKRKKPSPATAAAKKSKKINFPTLHPVQLDVARRLEAVLASHGAAYLVAPPGSGKSALLRADFSAHDLSIADGLQALLHVRRPVRL